jgi:hypothetical protein
MSVPGFTIDIRAQELIRLPEVLEILPPGRGGKPRRLSTLYKWCRAGLRCPDGEFARLPSIKVGGAMVTSTEALTWWFRRLAGDEGRSAGPSDRATARRAHVARELDRLGL